MGHSCSRIPSIESCEYSQISCDKRLENAKVESVAARCRAWVAKHPERTEVIFCLIDMLKLGAQIRLEDLIGTQLKNRALKNLTIDDVILALQIKILVLKLTDLLSGAPNNLNNLNNILVLPRHIETNNQDFQEALKDWVQLSRVYNLVKARADLHQYKLSQSHFPHALPSPVSLKKTFSITYLKLKRKNVVPI